MCPIPPAVSSAASVLAGRSGCPGRVYDERPPRRHGDTEDDHRERPWRTADPFPSAVLGSFSPSPEGRFEGGRPPLAVSRSGRLERRCQPLRSGPASGRPQRASRTPGGHGENAREQKRPRRPCLRVARLSSPKSSVVSVCRCGRTEWRRPAAGGRAWPASGPVPSVPPRRQGPRVVLAASMDDDDMGRHPRSRPARCRGPAVPHRRAAQGALNAALATAIRRSRRRAGRRSPALSIRRCARSSRHRPNGPAGP